MKHEAKLISGTFDKERAKILITMLLAYKIDFHEKEKFSQEIRRGTDPENTQKRIEELKSERARIKEIFDSMNDDAIMKINCTILIEQDGN